MALADMFGPDFSQQDGNSWSIGDLESNINDQIYQRNNGDWDGNDYGFSFFNAGTGMSGVSDDISSDSRAQDILNKIARGEDGQYSYGGNLRDDLTSAFGPKGISSQFYLNPKLDSRTNFSDSYGKSIYQTSGNERQSWGDKWMPMIVGTGLGAIVGPAVGAAYGTAAGGAAAGATSGYVQSGGDWDAAGKGALYGGLTGGVADQVNSGLQDYTTKVGNNPSAYQPGMLSQQQTNLISKGAGNIAGTAVRGGDLGDAIRSAAMPVAGSFAQPYVQQGMSSIGNMFNGGEQPMDDYGFNSALDNFDYGQGAIPQTDYGFGNNYVNQEQLGGVGGFDLGSMFQGGMEPQRASPQSAGGADYSLGASSNFATPGFNPNAGGVPQAAGNDWLDFFKKNGQSAGMEILRGMNPQAYKALQALGLGGSQQPSALGTGVGLLASLYGSNRANKELGKQQGYLSQQQNAFGPNSAYAQQLRQQLDRKDAAGGRRSQYGPREVELQARLAEMNSRQAPALAQQQMMLSQARNQARMAPLQQLAYYGSNGGLKNLSQGLGDLFDDVQTPFGPGVIG